MSVQKQIARTSNLRQQNLFAWRPILTANLVIPLILVIGIVVLLAGIFFPEGSKLGSRVHSRLWRSMCNQHDLQP
ncbi:hypothetical protein M3Y94_01077000 [Aphelenchoides besseyi]|nr:hypothetical protein M3Y94_01077000 [Aphelenchoides besseyi]